MTKRQTSYSNSTILMAIIGLQVLLLLPSLRVPFYNVDEVTNALFAHFITRHIMGLNDFVGSTYFLTHYLYAALDVIFPLKSLLPVHLLNLLWRVGTLLAFYLSGKEMADEKTGRWAAFFYVACAHSFMSKDFFTPSAESLSLLPAVTGFYFLARSYNSQKMRYLLLSGILGGMATLFKTPMGVIGASTGLFLLLKSPHKIKYTLTYSAAFFGTLFSPALLVMPFGHGFELLMGELLAINKRYINVYAEMSGLYLTLKFLLRFAMIAAGMYTASFFVFLTLRNWKKGHLQKPKRDWIFFLLSTLIFLCYSVVLGKRVFYHYFVFLLSILPLLAAFSVSHESHARTRLSRLRHFLNRNAIVLALIPPIGFAVEASFNFSTLPPPTQNVIQYVKDHSTPNDTIYVWGYVPQIYIFSDRMPATTVIMSDSLAGTSPGSPAMEYMRVTGDDLTLAGKMATDFKANPFEVEDAPDALDPEERLKHDFSEKELFSASELIDSITDPYWKKTMQDFFNKPPQLFIDTSPSNIRGFGHYPLSNYELLKRFVLNNYDLVTTQDKMYIYQLRK